MANEFQTISIRPLTGALNTRARPADLNVGEFRWKLNMALNDTGRLCRRDGYQRFGFGSESFKNKDHHYRGRTRLPITMLHESTASDGARRLFDATDKEVSVFEPDATAWKELAFDMGGANGARWRMAELQDVAILTNNFDTVRSHTLGTTEFNGIADLATLTVTKARVVIQFAGFILLMNIKQDGIQRTSRVMWSDINRPLKYIPGAVIDDVDSLANFQDLDYGDDIIAAAPLGGNLMIYTRRSIWRCYPAGSADLGVFAFQKVYSEPENQKGCIVYPNTLVNLGDAHMYASRDDFYVYSPYTSKPQNLGDWEWLHNANGIIFSPLQYPTYALDPDYCESPVAKYVPVKNEVWISWPAAGANGINNHTLVANIQYRTCDYVDDGFTAFVNDRQTLDATKCNETQVFVGAASRDYGLKAIGGAVFKRELMVLTDENVALDVPEPTYYDEGYNSLITGLLPLGFPDKDKRLNSVELEHDTVPQDSPCLIKLRIGNSFTLADPIADDGPCAVQWRTLSTKKLQCAGTQKVSALAAKNLRPGNIPPLISWNFFYSGRYMYFELSIFGPDGPAVGGDSAWSKIDVKALVV